jgi:hypothetical protein
MHALFSGHYCPNGTKVSNQYPCPAGTFNNGTGLRWDTECSACQGLFTFHLLLKLDFHIYLQKRIEVICCHSILSINV